MIPVGISLNSPERLSNGGGKTLSQVWNYEDGSDRLIEHGVLDDAASRELRPGGGRLPQLVRAEETVGAGEPTSGDTVHLDVADRFGNLVSATPSGGWLQSSPVISELGWPLGTRAQMFWLETGLPSSLRPRTRPRRQDCRRLPGR